MIEQLTHQDLTVLLKIASRKSSRHIHPTKIQVHMIQYKDVVEAMKELGWTTHLCGHDELYCKRGDERAVLKLESQD
jgi:hypothetical protein